MRVMVAITRCQEAKEDAFRLVAGNLQILKNLCFYQEILNFKDQVVRI